MRAINEIGLRKTIRFLLYVVVQIFYHLIIDHFLFFPHSRKLVLKLLGSKVGEDAIIMNVKFCNWHHLGPKGLTIGKECFIGDDCLIDLYDSVTIKNQVTLAPKVTVLTHTNVGYKNHLLQKYFPKKSRPVVFEDGSVIGAGAIILPGIIVGKNSFVGAGSVVTKNVPANCVYAGNPAKLIKEIKIK